MYNMNFLEPRESTRGSDYIRAPSQLDETLGKESVHQSRIRLLQLDMKALVSWEM